MGRKELGIKKLKLTRFDLGYFPNKDFDDVPDGGSPDCKHVLFRDSDLRPFPGMAQVNTTQASNTSGQGIHYINTNGITKRVAVFGDKFYEDVSGVWTDRTSSVSIGAGDLVKFVDHQIGANEYVIGTPGGGNPPFKWTGSGDAEDLGGSPSNFDTIEQYHGHFFGALKEVVSISDVEDPETWGSTNVLNFDKDVKNLVNNGSKLAVMMEDHIGSVQGFDILDFVQENSEIRTFGCVGKLAATNCNWGESDLKVVATVSRDGLWVFDEAFNGNKVLGNNWFREFNKSNLSKSSLAYWEEEKLLFMSAPFGSSTEPDHLTIINTETGAYWPGPSIHSNYIRALASMKDSLGNEFIYYVDNNGYAFRFDMDTTSYHTGAATEAIDYKWRSKRFDLEDIHSLGELNMLAGALGNWGVIVGVHFGLSTGDGATGNISFFQDEDLLGKTFVLGASTLGSSEYVFSPLVGIGGFGRFLQVTITPQGSAENDVLGTSFILGESSLGSVNSFKIKRIEIDLHRHRTGGSEQ
jgi:hypothetical protein|tara:strand:+ start:11866 stop:13434 length:1569 start_codon:yes stop_codon:yes gene_type:complete